MNRTHSQADWIARAASVLPAAGFGNFDPGIVISHGQGSRVWDEDGTEYIDYLIGSGPMLLGHGHPEVTEAVLQQLPKGMTFFANNSKGIELAEEIVSAVPCAEQVRYVSSGGEADMYAPIQRMADLPSERVNQSAPFDFVGIDFFGPFSVKYRRSLIKNYGCLSHVSILVQFMLKFVKIHYGDQTFHFSPRPSQKDIL